MKHPPLSPRLTAIADLIAPCHCMADIGTDHGYLPVWLCLENRTETAIACDINQGPLSKAAETVRRFGVDSRISLRLGGGAEPLTPGEANAIVIAGMGGLLIGEILDESPKIFQEADQILLQPMSSIPELRERLFHMGYTILEEILVPEEEKLYHILSVTKTPEAASCTSIDFILGRRLCKSKPAHFSRYLAIQKARFSQKLAGLKQGRETDPMILEETVAILKAINAMIEK